MWNSTKTNGDAVLVRRVAEQKHIRDFHAWKPHQSSASSLKKKRILDCAYTLLRLAQTLCPALRVYLHPQPTPSTL